MDAADTLAEPPSRRGATRTLLGAAVLVVVAGGVGDTASPVLVVHAPLLLVALNPRARNVLLASPTVAVVPLVGVSLIRRLVPIPVLYRLGRIHGDTSLAWADRRFPRSARWLRRVERWFHRAEAPVVLLLPGMLTAYLAGSTGMREATLLLLSTLSIAVRLAVLLVAGNVFNAPLTWLLHVVASHQWSLLALSITITVAQALRLLMRRRRRAAASVVLLGHAANPPDAVETSVGNPPPPGGVC